MRCAIRSTSANVMIGAPTVCADAVKQRK